MDQNIIKSQKTERHESFGQHLHRISLWWQPSRWLCNWLTLKQQSDRRLQRHPNVDKVSSFLDLSHLSRPTVCKSRRCDSTCTSPNQFGTRQQPPFHPVFRYWNVHKRMWWVNFYMRLFKQCAEILHFNEHWKGGISQLFTPARWVKDLNGGTRAMCQWDLIRAYSWQGQVIEFLGKLLSCVIQHSNKSVSFCWVYTC